MGRSLATVLLAALLAAQGAGGAAADLLDAPDIDPAGIQPSGAPDAAYLDAVSGEGLQTDIVYLRPSAPFDPVGPEAPATLPRALDPDAARLAWAVFFGALLAAALAFAVRHGRRIGVSFRAPGDEARRPGRAPVPEPAPELPPERFLESLGAMQDRRAALILLARGALERAAQANGLHVGRAQTARDVLGAVPRRWPHLEALRRIVREAEIVHFGGRDLPEARWRDCLEAAAPLFAGRRP